MPRRFATLSLLLLAGGCALGPDYERPEVDMPERYVQPVQEGESFANAPWWNLFADPELQKLIRIALQENQDLGIAVSRIEEFRAILGVTRADQLPNVDVNGGGNRGRGSSNVFPGNLIDGTTENYRLAADAFFEVDLLAACGVQPRRHAQSCTPLRSRDAASLSALSPASPVPTFCFATWTPSSRSPSARKRHARIA